MIEKKEVKIRQNIFAFNLAEDIKENDLSFRMVRILARKYIHKYDLIQDALYKHLVQTGAILGVQAKHNLVPTVGRNVLARLLAGDATYTGEVTHGALGSAATPAFTNASATLTTETYRKAVSSASYSDNIVYIDLYIASGDVADGTYEEFGYFIDGTGAADSGQAWSLLRTGGWVKSGSLFVSGQYTIT